ncbi:MAG: MlaD family protein [Planctomycetota bacterium]
MKPAARDTLTGLLVIAGAAGLFTMLVVFGELTEVGKQHFEFGIKLPTARGLTPTSTVTMNGVRIGEIVGLENTPDPREGIVATVRARAGTVIPNDFSVFLEQGLIAGSSLDLVVSADSAGEPVANGDVFEPEISSLFADLLDRTEVPIATLTDTAERISTLADTYDRLGRTLENGLGEQFEPRTSEDVAAGARPNLMSAIARLNEAADSAVAIGAEFTQEGGIRDQVEQQLARAADVIDELMQTSQSFRLAADSATETLAGVDEAVVSLNSTAIRVGDAAEEARIAIAAVNAGEGTMGQLAQNPDLYNSLQSATDRLQAVLGEAELVIARIREDGVKIGW